MPTQIINNGTQILGNDGIITGGTQVIGGGTQVLNSANQAIAAGTQIIGDSTTGSGDVFAGGLLTKGTEISGWRIVDKINVQSGEADLYIAEKNGEKGVIKYYRGHIHPKSDLLEKITNLHHPDIINVYEFGDYQGHFYEIMDYAAGGALDTRNEDGSYKYLPLPEDKVIQACKEIINSYKTCHEKGIIHRDIKPANIYYKNADGSDIVIGDFGISSLYGEDETVSHKTQTASRTTGYAAPEVLSGIISPKMDYYALGITLWELSTGKDPFVMDNGKRRNDAHLLRDTIEGRIADDLLSREPRLSDSMQHLIRGLLVIDDKKRWGYEEVVRHLNGEHVAVAQKEVSAWEYSVENTNCTTLEQVGTSIFNNLSSESLRKEIFRGFLVSFFEDKYPDVAKKMEETIEESSSDMELCLKKIALLLNPTLPYITQNGYKIENIDDVVNLILNAPEEMISVLDAKNKWFYIYFEHLGYKDKIQDILSITKDIDKSSGFNAMLALGKIVVLLRDNTIRPFTQDKYKNITLTDFEQLSTLSEELKNHIVSTIRNRSLDGLILPWLLTMKTSLNITKIKEWDDLVRPVKANEIFVGKEGITEFSSIQNAIDKAEDGFIINIDEGIYEESISVTKKLTFIGANKEKVVIQQPKECVCVILAESSFKNISFKNTEKNEEKVLEAPPKENALVKCNAPVTFENCDFTDSFTNGIDIENSNNGSIINCRISNIAYRGITLKTSNYTISNTEVAFTGWHGIIAVQDSNVTVNSCKIHDSKNDGLWTGEKGKLVVESCEVYQIKFAGVCAFGEGSEIKVTNCKIHDVLENGGLVAAGKGKLSAYGCEIYQTYGGVVSVFEGSQVSVTDCKIHNIEVNGVEVANGGNLTAEYCEVYQTKKAGVNVYDDGSEISLTNCNVYDIPDNYGLFVFNKGKLSVDNCEVYQTKLAAVYVDGEASKISLTNCKVHDILDGTGLIAKDKGKLTAENCEVYQTKKAGVWVGGEGSEIRLTNCMVHDNPDNYGVVAKDKGKLISENCEVYQTEQPGVIVVGEGSEIRLSNCKVHNVFGSCGFVASDKGKLTAENCEVYQTKYAGVGVEKEGSQIVLTNCKVHDIPDNSGLYAEDKGNLTAKFCEVYQTKNAGVFIKGVETIVELQSCVIHHSECGIGIESTDRGSVPNISTVTFGEGISTKVKKPGLFSRK